jgi:uncharacterized membrane protein
MSERTLMVLTWVTAVGCAVVGGVFFAFSTFIMAALGRLAPASGIAAMQAINVTVINGWFMGAFLGSALGCAVLGVASLLGWSQPGMRLRLTASAVYLLGSVMVTMACNVPHNDALARVQPESAEGAALFAEYLSSWTAWNHVRTAASVVAGALLALSLVRARG